MTIKQKIQSLVAGLKYQTSFEDVCNEPSYVVDQILNLIEKEIKLGKKEVDFEVYTSDVMARRMGYNDAIRDLEALKQQLLETTTNRPME